MKRPRMRLGLDHHFTSVIPGRSESVTHLSHPYKVEAWDYSRIRSAVIGRAMFRTEAEAREFADTGDELLPVQRSKPGDREFA